MAKEFKLSNEELQEAAVVVRRSPLGVYTLANLYGSLWRTKVSPTNFGSRFKASVIAGQVAGITVLPQKTGANAVQYQVHNSLGHPPS
jgi:hypothetical protein